MDFATTRGGRAGRAARGWLPLLFLLAMLGARSAAADECAPWPGEPEPLPTLDDPDPLRARWAELRVSELSQRAQGWEETLPVEAYRLWRRVLCLQPESFEATLGAARTRPVRIYRPAVVRGPGSRTAALLPPADLWIILSAPISLESGAPPAPAPDRIRAEQERRQSLAGVEQLLQDGERRLKQARFAAALEAADEARAQLDRLSDGGDLRAPRVRLELLTATAQLALGDEPAARESLARAVAAEPGLRLDPMRTSPKLRRALMAVRDAQENER